MPATDNDPTSDALWRQAVARPAANGQLHIVMPSQQSTPSVIALAQPAAAHGDTDGSLDAQLGEWRRIEAALSPVIGHRGVAALFKRSLYLTLPAHPWLAFEQEGAGLKLDLAALGAALAAQTTSEASAGAAALLATFSELLASLIGASLTERLLRRERTQPSRGPPTTDPST